MPFTHVEVEERTSAQIAILFVSLLVLYSGSLLVLLWVGKCALAVNDVGISSGSVRLALEDVVVVFACSLGFGAVHWSVSSHRLFERVLEALAARPTDPEDTYHATFVHIVQEVSVATGGRSIQAYVISTPAVNACSFADFSGRAAIAVTEGALAVLTREQLESVIGHEAAHIVRGDSLITSALCGLFALHEEALKRLHRLFDAEGGGRAMRGRGALIVLAVMMVLWLTTLAKKIGEMCLSREKEYRADAVAIRLTRNPLSLAEALYTISTRWRGVGMAGESLSSLFIMDTGIERLSEREGVLAELFSTHPPTDRRLALLLGMAHLDPSRFEEEMLARLARPRERILPAPVRMESPPAQWMVWADQRWIGPVGLAEVTPMAALAPDTWVRRVDSDDVKLAHQDPQLLAVLRKRYAGAGPTPAEGECPRCHVGLVTMRYEGAPISTCPACSGCFVDADTITRVFARQEYDFPEAIKRRGDALLSATGYAQARQAFRAMPRVSVNRACPRCNASVVRKFYTEAYPVEVEQCWSCGCTWLDHDALELLQYLYEKRRQRPGAIQ